jgi:regulator of cell morphogenesis and NO signaling
MPIDPNSTLADLVSDRVELAPVLGRLGLDFCCGGDRPLAEAVRDAGYEVGFVLAELDAVAPRAQPDWHGLEPVALIDHLESTHHRFLRERLPYLSEVAAKVVDVHGANHPELAQIATTFAELRADLEPHLLKEEQVLFPMVRELFAASGPVEFHCGTLQNPVSVMSREHDRAGELLARLRDLSDDFEPPADACASYRALYAGLAELESDTHLHVHKENNLLFPAIVAEESRHAR